MGKRILLFLLTNLAVIAVISIILSIFNVQPYLTQHGLDYQSLLIYAAIVGFTGAFISLFLSKTMAKHGMGVQIITQPKSPYESWLVTTIQNLARQSNIGMPEVGIYDSPEPNAFATGWNKNSSLVAVSSGLLNQMSQDEIEGVLGHEISHVANGDMVTMSLIQGVVNTFVIFFARIAAFIVTQFFRRNEEDSGGGMNMMVYYLVSIAFEILFGILASLIVMAFSRYREFRADAGSARLVGKGKMIAALRKLQMVSEQASDNRMPSLATFKISSHSTFAKMFSSHPPLEKRIEALEKS